MNILFFHHHMAIGGAQINAITLGHNLVRQGHRVIFMADDGVLSPRLAQYGIQYHPFSYKRHRHLAPATIKALVSVCRKERIDTIWCTMSNCAIEAYVAGYLTNTPVFPLYSGERLPAYHLPHLPPIGIVNLGLRERLVGERGWTADEVLLIRERMDLESFHPFDSMVDPLYDFDPRGDLPRVAWIGRVAPQKLGCINLFLSAARELVQQGVQARCFIIGPGESLGPVQSQVAALAKEVGDEGAIIVTGGLLDMPPVFNAVSVVLGMASTCILSLACARPTIVLGPRGFSEIITPDNAAELAHHHFNFLEPSAQPQPDTLCGQIESIVKDREFSARLSDFGPSFAKGFDVRIGAQRLAGVMRSLTENGIDWRRRPRVAKEVMHSLLSVFAYRIRRRLQRGVVTPTIYGGEGV